MGFSLDAHAGRKLSKAGARTPRGPDRAHGGGPARAAPRSRAWRRSRNVLLDAG